MAKASRVKRSQRRRENAVGGGRAREETRAAAKKEKEKKNVKIHRRYAPSGAAVNNETLHQRGDACGVFIA